MCFLILLRFIQSKMGRFKWQINASSVAKLIGAFQIRGSSEGFQTKALAECWRKNLDRMPRFNVVPSTTMQRELAKRRRTHTAEEAVHDSIKTSATMRTFVEKAVENKVNQSQAVKALEKEARDDVQRASKKLKESHVMRLYNTIKSGLRTRAQGFFAIKGTHKVYQMSNTGRSAKLSTVEEARAQGWVLPVEQVRMKQVVEEKKVVAKHMRKVATSAIQTAKGIRAESDDLKKVQEKAPQVRAGNKKAYFLTVSGDPYKAFVIGYIDGLDPTTRTVIELKHRTRGLFRRLREYERIQCFVYMKMLKARRAKLIETYAGEQLEYDIEWDDATWSNIESKLREAVKMLNLAEKNPELRAKWIQSLL